MEIFPLLIEICIEEGYKGGRLIISCFFVNVNKNFVYTSSILIL